MKLLIIILGLNLAWAAPIPIVNEMYFNLFAGHLHQMANSDSTSLKQLSCGDKVRVLTDENMGKNESRVEWLKVNVGAYIGHVRKDFLVNEPPTCFSNKYLKFVEQFKLEITDKYNLGRLYDNYIWGKSKVK